MSQALSSHDAEYRRVRTPQRSGNLKTRRAKAQPELERVPMLDWPAELFSDDATAVELISEDFAVQYDLAAISYGGEMFAQVAA